MELYWMLAGAVLAIVAAVSAFAYAMLSGNDGKGWGWLTGGTIAVAALVLWGIGKGLQWLL